ncbi:hypothetical protein GQ457_03G012120 [Hibiscus cannabinus]
MAIVVVGSLLQNCKLYSSSPRLNLLLKPFHSLDCSRLRKLLYCSRACFSNSTSCRKNIHVLKASSTGAAPIDTSSSNDVLFNFELPEMKRMKLVELKLISLLGCLVVNEIALLKTCGLMVQFSLKYVDHATKTSMKRPFEDEMFHKELYIHKGRYFKVPLMDYFEDDDNMIQEKTCILLHDLSTINLYSLRILFPICLFQPLV